VSGCAEEIARELCYGTSQNVAIQVRSGWLAEGAGLEFVNLRAGYGDFAADIVNNVTVTIPRSTKVGIMGKTGSGKSSVLLCILRILEPRGGRIFLEGVDTQSLGLRTLRSAMGVVPQDPVLLQGTLRQNLDPFSHHQDAKIWHTLRLAQLDKVVRDLEGGLDCMVDASGSNLSYGERQLVSLTRIILRRPMLLMLDEATSAIDPHTQEIVLSTLLAAFANATMLSVTHRLETILVMDMGIIMDKGTVVEAGPVKDLIEHGQFLEKLKGSQG